ncbi:MAG: VOC family protein [Salinarimonas sp.]|nr:VOC family protein [Salinarimonas sp.]
MQTTTDGSFDMSAAPLRIATLTLKVRDLAGIAQFYRDILGLAVIASGEARISLGIGGQPLLILEGDPALDPLNPREAGLFHTAFLLPGRADLGRWLAHAMRSGVRLQGASDHIVSEALYLADPEGNGIEIYRDRPAGEWQTPSGEVRMATLVLDLDDLRASAGDSVWDGFPAGGVIGHVHLQVGDTMQADGFYRDILGFDVSARYPGASFYGSGGYHHQLAGNVWNSKGAGRRSGNAAGLGRVDIMVRDADHFARIIALSGRAGMQVSRGDAAVTIADPWGTQLRLTPPGSR